MAVGIQSGGRVADQWIRRRADRDDHGVDVECVVRSLFLDRAAASGSVRLAEFHLDALHGKDLTVRIAVDPDRVVQVLENDSLFLGVMDFFAPGRHFGIGTAVYDVDFFRTESLGRTGGIHRDVSSADDGDGMALADGGVVTVVIGLHEVGACQVFVCRIDADKGFALDLHEARKTRARADEDSFVSVLEKFVDG